MPAFDQKKCFDYDVYHEGENKILKIYCESCPFPPSLEDSPLCLSKTFDLLLQVSGVTVIILTQRREYEYDYSQTSLLIELALLYKRLNQEERDIYHYLITDPLHEPYIKSSYALFQRLLSQRLKEDPLQAYVELKRQSHREKIKLDTLLDERPRRSQEKFLAILHKVLAQLEKTKLITLLLPHLPGYQLGQREIYKNIFHPTTRPDFMYTKLVAEYPEGEILESYSFGEELEKADVTLFAFPDNIKTLYHLNPPEFKFTEEQYELLDTAKRILAEHKPTREEFVDPQRMREVFYNIGKDLLNDLVNQKNLRLSEPEINQLAQALLRYTVGFGLIEILLSDSKVQDVNINSPNGQLPIFLVHQDYGDCYTNIYPTPQEVDSWATKLRLISGRPLDEANPILDTELKVTGFSSRVAALCAPLNPTGLAFSFRRHRDYPWTFPLYLSPKIKMFNPLAAGLLSFLIDNNATILISGTRSSGKTSLMGSFLVELMRRYRLITIEDSVTEDTEIIIKKNKKLEKIKIGKLINQQIKRYGCKKIRGREVLEGNPEKIKTYSFNFKTKKIVLKEIRQYIRHKTKKAIYSIETESGKKIKVTGDHSLFGFKGKEVKVKTLKKDDVIISVDLKNKKIIYDRIKLIKKIKNKKERYVYDLSIPKTENFIANNLVAHNTFELPQESLRALGYNIESLKVASALAAPGTEVDASTGIRSTLRLGDSALFIGEVRSKEAIALFEAMRVGAAANVVAGTIHAASPYGVYDRVVNDIGVPKTSFKAIDFIIQANPVKSASGLKRYKRVLSITEVRKEWEEDPLKEGAFVDLMKYNPQTDELEVTDDLRNGNSDLLKRMAGSIKEFAGDWDAVWNNIQLRADVKKALLDIYEKVKDDSLLEAPFVIKCNDMFHLLSDKVKEEVGFLDPKRILFEYKEWLKKEVKKGRL